METLTETELEDRLDEERSKYFDELKLGIEWYTNTRKVHKDNVPEGTTWDSVLDGVELLKGLPENAILLLEDEGHL